MQPIRYVSQWLSECMDEKRALFTSHDLRVLCPQLSEAAFKTLLSRLVRQAILVRVCRGLYLYKKALLMDGLFLFHAAALVRPDKFNYVSLETVLSTHGVISQIPMNWISIMSSGRSSTISCGDFGTIEFIHTRQQPDKLVDQLIYDYSWGLWRANVALAISDMKLTRRSTDLIDWKIANELI